MPGDCIQTVLEQAQIVLDEWIAGHPCLCDLKRSNFSQPYPYDEPHMQALYLLRYFPAYFAENYMVFEKLKELGLQDPIIESIGCGCLVDCAAANDYFKRIIPYTGYDINDWGIKSVDVDGKLIELRIGNVVDADGFYTNSNVFIFPKSLGDLNATVFKGLQNKIRNEDFSSKIIFVCATYRANDFKIANDMTRLHIVAAQFTQYEEVESTLYYPADEKPPQNSGINTYYPWFEHPAVDYCRMLLARCRKDYPTCPEDQCRRWVSTYPMLRLGNFAFEIIKLRRR